MNRRGFVLLAVLWIVVILATVAGAIMGVAAMGARATGNRIVLTRAEWARDACIEIVLTRWTREAERPAQDTVDLGRGTRCSIALEDPGAKVNLNHASPEQLRALFGADSLVAALLDWRDPDDDPRTGGAEAPWYRQRGRPEPRNGPLVDPAEFGRIKGFDKRRMADLGPFVTVDGVGRIDLLAAPPEVLRTLPQLGGEAIDRLIAFRRTGLAPQTVGELEALLSPSGKARLERGRAEFEGRVGFGPALIIGHAVGWVEGSPLRAQADLHLVPTEDRLAVTRRVVR